MPAVEVSLPDDLYAEFEQLVDQEFLTEEQAAEELLSLGIDAYQVDTTDSIDDPSEFMQGAEGNLWDNEGDPSMGDDTL